MPSSQVAVKRPVAVTGVTLLQFLLGFLWLGITLYLLLMSRHGEMNQRTDPAAVLGLEIAAAVVAPGAVFGLIAAYALYKDKLWGWWLSLLINVAFALMLTYSMVDEGWEGLDLEIVAYALLSLMPLILLSLPAVRRFYWRKPATIKGQRTVS